MIYLAFDDTDSRKGMCTTALALPIIKEIERKTGYLLADYPHLVRLNPNIPWKTRGNGAVSLVFRPPPKPVAVSLSKGILFAESKENGIKKRKRCYPFEEEGKSLNEKHYIIKKLGEILKEIIHNNSELAEKDTHPGFAIFSRRPPEKYYRWALHKLVKKEDFEKEINKDCEMGLVLEPFLFDGFKKERGIVGSIASASWNWKNGAYTFEILAYRTEEMLGKKRKIRKEGVKKLSLLFPTTFNNYDRENDYCAVIPNSSCPVLYGIRGTDPVELFRASDFLDRFVEEPIQAKVLFRTNQGTDEHIKRASVKEITPYGSFRVKGRVCSQLREIKGGHIFFEIQDGDKRLTCAAFEPTKGFRHIVRKLEVGDVVECWGGVHQEPFTLNLEKIAIYKLVKKKEKVANPLCQKCGRRMKSAGRGMGYRCRMCGTKKGEDEAQFRIKEREISQGIYQVPVIARRHLAKPLSLEGSFGTW